MIELDNQHETRSYEYFNLMADTHTQHTLVSARNVNTLIPNTEKIHLMKSQPVWPLCAIES